MGGCFCHSAPQESRWAHVQSTAAQKTLLLGQIKLAVLSLFQLVTARLEVPSDVALEDTEAQLDTVSTALSPGQWGWGGHKVISIHGWLCQPRPGVRRCCSACRTWLTFAPSCAPGSRGRVLHACLQPPARVRSVTGLPGCPRAGNSPRHPHLPAPGAAKRLPQPARSPRTHPGDRAHSPTSLGTPMMRGDPPPRAPSPQPVGPGCRGGRRSRRSRSGCRCLLSNTAPLGTHPQHLLA